MNIALQQDTLNRIRTCVFDMNNKVHCYQTTGIHYTTIDRIMERGFAKQAIIDKLLGYCAQVEGLTITNSAD